MLLVSPFQEEIFLLLELPEAVRECDSKGEEDEDRRYDARRFVGRTSDECLDGNRPSPD